MEKNVSEVETEKYGGKVMLKSYRFSNEHFPNGDTIRVITSLFLHKGV